MTTIDFQTKTNSRHGNASPRFAAEPTSSAKQVNYQLVAVPTCVTCKTDEYLFVEEYAPPLINDDGELDRLGEASFFCTRCLQYGGHSVPPLWTPNTTA